MHVHIDKIQEPIDGFFDSFSGDGRVNMKVLLALTSDDPAFYKLIAQISSTYFSSTECSINASSIHSFLILVHTDLSADIYINDFPVATTVRLKRSLKNLKGLKVGTPIRHSEIADICELSFPDINIQDSDSVVCCLKVGWKFLLYFDSRGRCGQKTDVALMLAVLGQLYRYLSFQEVYDTLESKAHFKEMVDDGWFPFVEILGTDYERLAASYENGRPASDHDVKRLLEKFDEARVKNMTDKWWEKPLFQKKQGILQAGIDAFLQGTESGYINCIKNLYMEIEGIMQVLYFEDNQEGTRSTQKLLDHLKAVAKNAVDAEDSLLFPDYFLEYLTGTIFKEFDLVNSTASTAELSRHSASHGVAEEAAYTPDRALQALLTLDQIYFYLPLSANEKI